MPHAVVALEWRKGQIKRSKLRRRPKVKPRVAKRKRAMMRDLNCTLKLKKLLSRWVRYRRNKANFWLSKGNIWRSPAVIRVEDFISY